MHIRNNLLASGSLAEVPTAISEAIDIEAALPKVFGQIRIGILEDEYGACRLFLSVQRTHSILNTLPCSNYENNYLLNLPPNNLA
jgi:hypothetical protein